MKVILLISLYLLSSSIISLNGQNYTSYIKMFSKVLQLSHSTKVYFVYNSSDPFIFNQLLKATPFGYYVTNDSLYFKLTDCIPFHTGNYILVIFTDRISWIESVVEKQIQTRLITARGRILVLTLSTISRIELEELFKNLWKKKILNLNVMFPVSNDKVNVYTFNPFKGEYYIKFEDNVKSFFPIKTLNYYGYPFRIYLEAAPPYTMKVKVLGSFKWIGLYPEFINALGAYYNITMDIKTGPIAANSLEVFFNNTHSVIANGLGKDILDGKFDFSFHEVIMRRSFVFDYIYPYQSQSLACLVPKSQPESICFEIIIGTLNCFITKSYFLIMFLTFLTIRFIFWIHQEKCDNVRLFLRLSGLLVGQSPYVRFEFASCKIVFMLWQFLSVSMTALFTGLIARSLIAPHDIVEELDPHKIAAKLDFNIYGLAEMISDLPPTFRKRTIGLDPTELYSKALSHTGKDVFVVSKVMADLILAKTKYKTNQEYAYYTTQPFVDYFPTMLLQRGTFFLNTINWFTLNSFEAELLYYWQDKSTIYNVRRDEMSSGISPLGFDQFETAFICLVVGYIVALVTFIGEKLLFCRVLNCKS